MNKKRSEIWLHFTLIDEMKAKCDFCQTILSYKGGGSSNLGKHILTKHPAINLQLEKQRSVQDHSASGDVTETENTNPTSSQTANASRKIAACNNTDNQPTIVADQNKKERQTGLKEYVGRPASVGRQKKLNRCLIEMIVSDLQPFSIVDDIGFQKYTAALDPSYELPSRTTLSRTLLTQNYEICVERVKLLLDSSEHITLTTDTWTSLSSEGYMAITAHFISANWELKHCLLNCLKLTNRHTAENLRNLLVSEARKWNIFDKVHTVVTDNAANIVAAVKLTGWNHFPCFAHTLNLIIQDSINIIKPLQQKVKAIVEYFHRSTTATEKFKSMQTQMNIEVPLKLKMDIVTRWNSTYFMFNRICDLQEPLNATLGILNNPVHPLDDHEWNLLKNYCAILKPFQEVTEEMSAENYITISKVILMVRGLQRALQKMRPLSTIDNYELIDRLLKNISYRFPTIENNMFLAQSTYLDPRYKNKGFTIDSSLKTCKESLIASMHRLAPEPNIQEELPPSNIDNTSKKESSIWDDFDMSVASTVRTSTSSSIIELRQYNEDEMISRKSDPLLWWKSRELIYTRLSKIAKKKISIVATSVPSERIFSKAGQLISERRNRLKSDSVQKILFLNANLKLK